MAGEAYVTMVYTESYAIGAVVLGHRLSTLDSTRDRVCLLTEGVSAEWRKQLKSVYTTLIDISIIMGSASPQISLLRREDLRAAATKVHVWALSSYDVVAYLDADTLPLGPLPALWEPELKLPIRAAPDCGWPDIFNSGVFVTRPDQATFERLVLALDAGQTFDGSDQGLLNEYFGERWEHLPFTYNTTSIATGYQYLPALNRFRADVKLVHFIGRIKPWDVQSGSHSSEFIQLWHAAELETRLAGIDIGKAVDLPPEAESSTTNYDPETIIPAPVDHWDASYHPPLHSRPEAAALEERDRSSSPYDVPSDVFVFPTFGPTTTQLPFESSQRRPERMF